jgi:hypothetical protein
MVQDDLWAHKLPLQCTGALRTHRQIGYTATNNYAPSGEHKQRVSLICFRAWSHWMVRAINFDSYCEMTTKDKF